MRALVRLSCIWIQPTQFLWSFEPTHHSKAFKNTDFPRILIFFEFVYLHRIRFSAFPRNLFHSPISGKRRESSSETCREMNFRKRLSDESVQNFGETELAWFKYCSIEPKPVCKHHKNDFYIPKRDSWDISPPVDSINLSIHTHDSTCFWKY